MRRFPGRLLLSVLLALCLAAPSFGIAAAPEAAPLTQDDTATNGMLRVWLSSIRSNMTYNLTLTGAYTFNGQTLSSGSKVKVEFSGGTVYVTANGTRAAMGSSVTFSRQSGGVKIAESLASGNVYPGDMRFLYSGSTAYVVCYLYIEDYIYGVLPYEMDNSFPLEALKAQAVTARTYGMRAKTSSGVYDVTDTTNHQVFRGVNESKARCIQAVKETWGIVLKYNGSYAGAYYSASNGGQTELNNHVWGGAQLGYSQIYDDPYDLSNPSSVAKSYLIYASPDMGSSVSAYALFKSALASKLGGSAGDYTINQVVSVTAHTPMYADPSRLYTKLQAELVYNGSSRATVDIPIFPTVESGLGLSINGSNNELYTVAQESKGFRVTARRYGHGVGMSQRGAEQMAGSGFSYAQILGFYYPGTQRVRMNLTTNWPSAGATPAPVEDPSGVNESTPATVSLTNPSDRLNLRATADDSGEVLARVPHGANVTILSTSGAWCKVVYGSVTGYVAKEYLRVSAEETPGQTGEEAAVVTLASGSLNLRSEARATASVIGSLPNGATVAVVEKGATWTKVRYQNQSGYVMTQYLTLKEAPAQSAATATVTLPNASETLNLRMDPSTSSAVLLLLRHGTVLTVAERNATWTKVTYQGLTGYVMNQFVTFSGDAAPTQAPTINPGPTAVPTAAPSRMATVLLSSGMLNLRSQPNTNCAILAKVPNGARVQVNQIGESWCAVVYGGASGYVMRGYLAIDGDAVTAETQAPSSTQAPADNSAAWVATRDGDRVNLRRTPSSSGTVLTRVPHGEKVAVLSPDPNWTMVSYGQYLGYISTQYLKSQPPEAGGGAAQLTQPTQPAQSDGAAFITSKDGDSVNLRRQQTTASDALALMAPGEKVTVLEAGQPWCKIIYRGLTGYVMGDFLSASAPAQAAPEAQQQAQPEQPEQPVAIGDKKTAINAGTVRLNSPTATLHLLSEPQDLSQETGKLGQGAKVDVLQYYGGDAKWLYVRSNGVEGYALREMVSLTYKLAAVSLEDAGSTLAVRASASSSAGTVASLVNGALVTVLDTNNGWAKVRLPDYSTGFVSMNYLTYK